MKQGQTDDLPPKWSSVGHKLLSFKKLRHYRMKSQINRFIYLFQNIHIFQLLLLRHFFVCFFLIKLLL